MVGIGLKDSTFSNHGSAGLKGLSDLEKFYGGYTEMKELDELKDKMSTAISILQWELADMWGHVSTRTPDGKHFLLRHLRPPWDPSIPGDDVLQYDLDGNLISGQRDQPQEIFFYTCPFKAGKNVGAVIHCHPPAAIALTSVGKKIIPIHQDSTRFGRAVPVAPWLYGIWREHGKLVTKIMGENCAVMIKGHGAIVTGKRLEEACINMVQLERSAKMILAAGCLGKVSPLSPGDVKKFDLALRSGSEKQVGIFSRIPLEWRYYESMVKKGERWSRL